MKLKFKIRDTENLLSGALLLLVGLLIAAGFPEFALIPVILMLVLLVRSYYS